MYSIKKPYNQKYGELIMLDDLEKITQIDKSNMLDTIADFPDQIKETIKIIDNSILPGIFKIDNIVISGMGGSAISGEIIKNLFRDRMNINISKYG